MPAQSFWTDPLVSLSRITPATDGQQYFFGYYDIPAFSGDGRYHLVNRVPFRDRLPRETDSCELCLIDLKAIAAGAKPEDAFSRFAETKAWNFQQGALLQWYPAGSGSQVIYNDWDGRGYHATVLDLRTGKERRIERPLANVSPNGHWGLSLNFDRIWNFRPGYGYCNRQDPWYNNPQPEEDGIWLVDLLTNTSRLLVSYAHLGFLYNLDPALSQRKIVVNHITFNRTSDRFLFLVRFFPEQGEHWLTGLGTVDLSGIVYLLRPYTYASHYHWRDSQTILIHTEGSEGPGMYELTDLSQQEKYCNHPVLSKDIHCSYSPDRRWIIGDGYPDKEGMRPVALYDCHTGRGRTIGRFISPPVPVGDIRCDLHLRWSPDGRHVSFDSTHEGYRGVYLLDLSALLDAGL
jgi:hypothetical protein